MAVTEYVLIPDDRDPNLFRKVEVRPDGYSRKYELRREDDLFRIYALRDIPNFGVRKGQRGGLVSGPQNLSPDGDCWINVDARVTGNANVYGDAHIGGDAQMSGNAQAFDNARVGNYAQLRNHANIYNNANICGTAILDDATASDNAEITGNSVVRRVNVSGTAKLISTIVDGDFSSFQIAAGRFIQSELHAWSDFMVVWTRWGFLTLARRRRDKLVGSNDPGYRVRVGCQAGILGDLHYIAHGNSDSALEESMVDGFIAMATPMVESWGMEAGDRTIRGDDDYEDEDDC